MRLAALAILTLAACPAPTTSSTCNSDLDCLNEHRCVDGLCVADAGEGEGEGGAEGEGGGEGEGEGEAEGEGEGGEGEGEGEGEGGEGEGEGEGEGVTPPDCAMLVEERFEESALPPAITTILEGQTTIDVDEGALLINARNDTGIATIHPRVSTQLFDLTGMTASVDVLALPADNAFLAVVDGQGLFDQINLTSTTVAFGTEATSGAPSALDGTTIRTLSIDDDGANLVFHAVDDNGVDFVAGTSPARAYLSNAKVEVGIAVDVNDTQNDRFFDDLRVSRGPCATTCIAVIEDDFFPLGPELATYQAAPGVVVDTSAGLVSVHLPDGIGAAQAGGVGTLTPIDARGLRMTTSLVDVPVGAEVLAYMTAGVDATHNTGALMYADTLYAQIRDGARLDAPSVPFDPKATPFVRAILRSITDELVVEVSSDGITFTPALSVSGLPAYLSSTFPGVGAETDGADGATTVSFDRFVLEPDGCP